MIPNWKVEYYYRDKPDEPFPPYGMLVPEEAQQFRKYLLTQLGLGSEANDKEIAYALRDSCSVLLPGHAKSPEFDILGVLQNLGPRADEFVLAWSIHWEELNEATAIARSDLARVFEYVWYPSSDDLFVFSEDAQSFVWIDHGGYCFRST